MPNNALVRRHVRRGYSLLEVSVALAIAGLAMTALVSTANDSQRQVKDAAAADTMSQVFSAAQTWMKANTSKLGTLVPVGGTALVPVGRPGPGTTAADNSLQAEGFLPSSFIDKDPYGQSHVVVVRQPTQGNFEMMVYTIGGTTIPDIDLGRIALKVGAAGGMVMKTPPSNVAANTVQGVGGGWSVPANEWASGGYGISVGHVAAASFATSSTLLADFLYRNNIGIPEANTMHTSIDMTGNGLNAVGNINNIDTVTKANAPITVGSALQGTPDASQKPTQLQIQNGAMACAGDATGCELSVSNDGGFSDPNTGWINFQSDRPDGRGLYIKKRGANDGVLATDGGVQMRNGAVLSWSEGWGQSPDAAPTVKLAGETTDGEAILHLYGASLTVDGKARIGSDLAVGGNGGIAGTLAVGKDADVGGNLGVTGSGSVGENLYVGNTSDPANTGSIVARYFWDMDNGSYYLHPSGTSNLNLLQATKIGTNGYSPTDNMVLNPETKTTITGGLHGYDVQAEGGVYVGGTDGGASGSAQPNAWLLRDGNGGLTGQFALGAVASVGGNCSPNGAVAASTDGSGELMNCYNGLWTRSGKTGTLSFYHLPDGTVYQDGSWFNLGIHYYCAVANNFETSGLGDVQPNAIRVYTIGTDSATGRPIWGMDRGNSGTQGGAASCIDY